jgi:hypothetical protein
VAGTFKYGREFSGSIKLREITRLATKTSYLLKNDSAQWSKYLDLRLFLDWNLFCRISKFVLLSKVMYSIARLGLMRRYTSTNRFYGVSGEVTKCLMTYVCMGTL